MMMDFAALSPGLESYLEYIFLVALLSRHDNWSPPIGKVEGDFCD